VVKNVKIITLILLAGIIIAATSGDNSPVTANPSPIKLYNRDRAKLNKITRIASWLNWRITAKCSVASPSMIASQAGEKELMSSDKAIPK
jgi:hypothetical protein